MDRILAGKLNKVIADDLKVCMRTVEVHRASLFEKMGVKTAGELAKIIAETPGRCPVQLNSLSGYFCFKIRIWRCGIAEDCLE